MVSRRIFRAAAAAQLFHLPTAQPQPSVATANTRSVALAVHLALAASLTVTVGYPSGAHAQTPREQTALTPAVQAPADDVRQYDIPAGPLSEVLTRFSAESGIFLSGATDLALGKRSSGLAGRYSVEAGLRVLLAGSGLTYRFTGASSVTLVAAQEGGGPVELGPIMVGGETGSGAVEGFRAETSRSATNVDAPLISTPATVNVLTANF
jgi:hypothetical protein